MKECCLLTYSPWFAQPAYITQNHILGVASLTMGYPPPNTLTNHEFIKFPADLPIGNLVQAFFSSRDCLSTHIYILSKPDITTVSISKVLLFSNVPHKLSASECTTFYMSNLFYWQGELLKGTQQVLAGNGTQLIPSD